MIRKLKPCTIVPPELYVSRAADKQLMSCLQDMGRPGYVLVARQMGKTNLLLNAKREIENKDNAVIYVDLSAPFETERECFRHIIDTALDSRQDIFLNSKRVIEKTRTEASAAPYREHENELRALLAEIEGKLIIFLDEIDSLTRTAFSDKIFAQIRSVYFNRTNYPLFKRLSYALSGVVEPSEIIKDKRISPFNIGEKIYLDDFSYDQFLDFLERAGLNLEKDAVDRIFHWANGNPRLTWDICIDVEECLAEGGSITSQTVDDSVKKLYLTDFSKAPIDHIREVVSVDDELRNAITVIKFGKGHELTDTIKHKLYLAGIISSVSTPTIIAIKNKIIEKSLSDQWLLDVSVKTKGLAKLASEKYSKHEYEAALALYEQLILSSDISEKEKESEYWSTGLCAYHTGQYEKALGYLDKAHWDKDDTAFLYYEREFYIGACYLQIGDIEDCRIRFEEAQNASKNKITYYNALMNLGVSYKNENNYARSIELYQKALVDIENSSLPSEDQARVKTTAFYSLAIAYGKMEKQSEAQDQFQKALDSSSLSQRPTIMLEMCQQLERLDKKENLLTECVELIITNNLQPDPSQSEGSLGLTSAILYSLLQEIYLLNRALFESLFTFVCALEELKVSSGEILLQLAYLSMKNHGTEITIRMARDVVEKTISNLIINRETEFKSFRLLSLLCDGAERRKFRVKYLECLKSGYEPKEIDSSDIEIFADMAFDSIKSNKPEKALEFINLAEQYKHLVLHEEMSEFAALKYYEMLALRNSESWFELSKSSHETLLFLGSLHGCSKNPRMINEVALKQIEEFAKSNRNPSADRISISGNRGGLKGKYKRNERVSVRYKDGKIKRNVKYKKIESDLVKKICGIIEK